MDKNITELFQLLATVTDELERRFEVIESLASQRDRFKAICAEIGIPIAFCRLRVCGKPFVPKQKNKQYHEPGCKDLDWNAYRQRPNRRSKK